jgi:hypothetical protein
MSGFGALGRRVGQTAAGGRLRRALEAGRVGSNVTALWKALRIDTWAAGVAPSPVIDHLRNDLALLLSADLEETLALLPIPGRPAGTAAEADDDPVTPIDCLVGMWFYSTEMARAIEALAAPTLPPADEIIPAREPKDQSVSLLR